ncbi:uncharacterized protein LOC142349118 [Convolutriloba macropyga]|uniref:uncharacterized protein LOC142349118 n=1 Tax=Convolutriloba macropyga TaxID=536237 RepID=UPI003F523D67
MTPLPVSRFPDTLSQFPFANTGIDFFGPFYIEDTKDKLTKYCGLIFTCMVTRAAHFESSPDLNTDTFLNALRRFASRRCQPKLILSDNGKTFVGANEELKRCVRSLTNQRIASELFIKNTVCKFKPPYGPHFGGAWERLIQNAKRIILIILGSKRFTSDVFQTIMVETKSMLNSRPLTHVADVPDNEEPITPNHFLVQRPYKSLPPGDFSSTMPASLKSWKNVQQLMNHVWIRLVKEYLPILTKRSKWSEQGDSLKVNDLVWILKDLTPRGIWPLGQIVETSPGKDGSVRVVKVKTAYGTYFRPVAGLARVLAD